MNNIVAMSRALQHHNHYPQARPPPPPLTPTSPLDFTDRIPFKELELSNETLGSGSFGTVFKGRWRGRHVAVKQFKTREEIDSFLVEVKQLSCVKHPNIVTLYGTSTLCDTAYLIMEYAEGGSLNHLLHECKQQQYDLRHACSWAKQTARGVAYLHGIRPKPIMHRDLKPANLLLFSRGKILKICDFGTACTVKTQMTNNTGSASYMAPEVFATSSYLESGDVFSWSIIFWEILARRQPYSQQYSNPYQILWRVKQEGARPNELENCPKIIWDLITRSWNKNPKKRPTMREVATEMELIFSLTDRNTAAGAAAAAIAAATNNSTSNRGDNNNLHQHHLQQQHYVKSPHRQPIPICSHFSNVHRSPSDPISCITVSSNNRIGQQPPLPSLKGVDSNGGLSMMMMTRHGQQQHSTSHSKRELYTHSKALLRRLQMLQARAAELEELARCNQKSTTWDPIEEYEELKKQTKLKNEELKDTYRRFSTFCKQRQCSHDNVPP